MALKTRGVFLERNENKEKKSWKLFCRLELQKLRIEEVARGSSSEGECFIGNNDNN